VGPEGAFYRNACAACSKQFVKTTPSFSTPKSQAVIQPASAEWCYHGYHTIKEIPKSDERRIRDDILVLSAKLGHEDLQAKINDIPKDLPNVRILTIQSGGSYDEDIRPRLTVKMPKLEKLQLVDVAFAEITLTPELTPLLETVELQNVPEDCQLDIVLPELKDFSMHYYGPADDEDDEWIHAMLQAATKLVSFDSYKLIVGPHLYFASNDLESIRLHRAEFLSDLTVYAPRLQSLNLQACYGFDGNLRILDRHAQLSKDLPRNFQQTKFEVVTTNSCLSNSAQATLESHPRIEWTDESEDWM